MKVFLTGATGFIGRCVLRYLKKEGYNILLLTRASKKNLQKILKSFLHIEYISGDLNLLMNCNIRLDITDMNLEDNFFNVTICNHVLEHIVDDRKAMSELFRVLRPVIVGCKVELYDIKRIKY